MTVITFDTYNAVKRLIQKGVREEQAEEFVRIFTEIKDPDLSKLASKEEVALLEKDVENIMQNIATKADLEKVRTELKTEVHQVEKSLEEKIHKVENKLILMIGGAAAATCSIIIAATKYMLQHLV